MAPEKANIIHVDGFRIRNTLDPDFGLLHEFSTDIARNKPKYYIPKGEVWIDHRFADEFDFLSAVDQFTLPDETHTYEEKRKLAKQKFCLPGPVPPFVRKRELKEKYEVVHVDGRIVRQYIDPEFMFGGHFYVYDYVPRLEIWLDEKMDEQEIPFVLLHEEVERLLMKKGKSYDIAHEHATATEKEARRGAGNRYPGDADYSWQTLSNREIIEREYVIR